jgi:murein DD-endopeptidase MepM/ murein hydrolase activator NlpD
MGLNKEQKNDFKEMFKNQLNLNKIRKGAEVIVVYQEFYKGKKKQYTGKVIAGEIKQGDNVKQAYLFRDNEGGYGYFAKNGKPLSEGIDRTPIEKYKRVSSKFTKARKHPVLGYVRPHKGVDYAAKPGTPIYAAASGKISMKDYQKKGYGKLIVINHKDGYSTLYGHMSKFKKGIYAGKKVKKGDVIGYVGTTGASTGPHLHFEVRKNGVHLDPQKAKIPTGSKLAKKDVEKFKTFIKKQNDGFRLSRLLLEKEGRTTIAIRKK